MSYVTLQKSAEDSWDCYLYLPAGYYEYKFLIEFDGGSVLGQTNNWICDVNRKSNIDEIYGGFYTELRID